MAKLSATLKNERRQKTIAKYAKRRAELNKIIRSSTTSDAEKEDARRKIRAMPRDASPTRYRNRCALTGRPRGYYRRFGVARIAFRELALRGELPGVTKSSW